eukprot:m.47497 g.47497  ORF g.47497 m.47497 type:complete len:97 (-) comp10769_c0_seq1:72-362(-)
MFYFHHRNGDDDIMDIFHERKNQLPIMNKRERNIKNHKRKRQYKKHSQSNVQMKLHNKAPYNTTISKNQDIFNNPIRSLRKESTIQQRKKESKNEL